MNAATLLKILVTCPSGYVVVMYNKIHTWYLKLISVLANLLIQIPFLQMYTYSITGVIRINRSDDRVYQNKDTWKVRQDRVKAHVELSYLLQ